jgi:hypothetical protein
MDAVAGMTFCARPLGVYSPGGLVSGEYIDSGNTFNADGTRTKNNGAATGPDNWIEPPFSGAGDIYWCRFTKTGGTRSVTSNNTFVSLASGFTWSVTGGAGTCSGDVTFATDASGSNAVSGGTFFVSNVF